MLLILRFRFEFLILNSYILFDFCGFRLWLFDCLVMVHFCLFFFRWLLDFRRVLYFPLFFLNCWLRDCLILFCFRLFFFDGLLRDWLILFHIGFIFLQRRMLIIFDFRVFFLNCWLLDCLILFHLRFFFLGIVSFLWGFLECSMNSFRGLGLVANICLTFISCGFFDGGFLWVLERISFFVMVGSGLIIGLFADDLSMIELHKFIK